LIEIINKQLLLQLVGYLCYWQMGFNSVFKGLKHNKLLTTNNNMLRSVPIDIITVRSIL